MADILVIGGTGFIGRALVERLIAQNHHVTIISRNPNPTPHPQITHWQLHRKNIAKLKKLLRHHSFPIVYDLAAFHQQHVQQITSLVPESLYIFVSSVAVYGDSSELLKESSPTIPLESHKYGQNKLLAEQYITQNCSQYLIIRPHVVFGPRDCDVSRAMYFFQRVSQQSPIVIPGFPQVKNNYVYVDDVANLLVQSLFFPHNTIYNVAGDEVFCWRQYLEITAHVMQKPIPEIQYLHKTLAEYRISPEAKTLQFHHNAFSDCVMSTEKAQSCGWSSQYTLFSGLHKTWEYYQQKL